MTVDINSCEQYVKSLLRPAEKSAPAHFRITDFAAAQKILRPRKRFSNKGDFGTGGLIAGSQGMMGAAVLCAKAFMRSGAGKLICHIPEIGYQIMQLGVPEAMAKVEPGKTHIISVSSLEKYNALAIGPGLGPYKSHGRLLRDVFGVFHKPLVVDADGLNAISKSKSLLKEIPEGSVLTPHPKEFERLFGNTTGEREKIDMALERAAKLRVTIVVKGAYSLVATAGGTAYFNNSGNSGLATGGTGDVLTGIITGLIAQHYLPEEAAILGVYLHGLAGDIAAAETSEEAMIAGDVTEKLGLAFRSLQTPA